MEQDASCELHIEHEASLSCLKLLNATYRDAHQGRSRYNESQYFRGPNTVEEAPATCACEIRTLEHAVDACGEICEDNGEKKFSGCGC